MQNNYKMKEKQKLGNYTVNLIAIFDYSIFASSDENK